MEKFAGMFTDSHGVRLVFRGTQALTDGKTIVVPELSLLARPNMTEEEVREALDFLMTTRGFIFHEGAHVIWSDFKLAERAVKKSPKFKLLVNALEDNRIEKKIADVYPGAREALLFTNEWTLARAAEDFTTAHAEAAKSGGTIDPFIELLYAIGIVGNLHPAARTWPMWSALSEQARTLAETLRPYIERAREAPSTKVVYNIAEKIWDLLTEEDATPASPPPPAAPEPGEGEPGEGEPGEGEPGEGEPGEGSDDASEGSSGPQDDADASEGGEGAATADDADDASEGSSDEATPGGDFAGGTITEGPAYKPTGEESSLKLDEAPTGKALDKADALGKFIRQAASDYVAAGGRMQYRPYSTENDFIGTPEEPVDANDRQQQRERIGRLTDEVRSAFGPVKRTLESLLKARTQNYYVRGLDAGELDSSNLHRLANAQHSPMMRNQARTVFQQKVHAQALDDTACALSIDMSGSMCGSLGGSMGGYGGKAEAKERLAQKCALIFAHALDGVKVPFEITAWSTSPHGTSTDVTYGIRKAAEAAGEPKVACTVHAHLGIELRACPCCYGYERVHESVNAAYMLYTRFGGLRVLEIKRFSEKWSQVDWRLNHVRGYHANYDGESVKLAAQRLMTRKEKRKVLFVLCDGIPGPDYGEDSNVHAKYLHEVVQDIRTTTPIELIGIGIAAPAAGEFYAPQFVNVSDTATLPRIVAEQLKTVLLK